MIFNHHRFQIWSKSQHPYVHALADFGYSNAALPAGSVTNLEQAMNWVFAVLYPNTQDAVATVGDLPAVGNTINDMRVVIDDGDGKAATYRWEQREGSASASWHKIYDMDWGYDSILSGFLGHTQDLYVNKYGRDDVDAAGDLLTGINAGQHVYGGKTAGSHLTLHANSGDGTGAQTGYIQAADNIRPATDSVSSLGTTGERWLKIWSDEITVGTLTLSGGSILDSSGAIDFGNENLTTTGSVGATSAGIGTLSLVGGSITDSSGAISFNNENLSTSGSITVGTLLLAGSSITDSSGTINFGNEDLGTTGNVTGTNIFGGTGDFGNILISGNTISTTNADGDILLDPNGIGDVEIVSGTLITLHQMVTGDVAIVGSLAVDDLLLDGSTISTTAVNADITFDPNGSGDVISAAHFIPAIDDSLDLGAPSLSWNNAYISNSISDGTNAITMANLLTFRAVGTPSTGHSLFWDGTKWVSSAADTEIDHGTISGLGDDDHTIYGLLAGRSGGQTLTGGSAANNNLTLESTSDVTKGNILFSSVPAPTADNATTLGAVAKRWTDLHMNGQAFGLRLANYTTAGRPAASAGAIGRVVYDTDLKDIFIDLGGTWYQISSEKYYVEDAANWDGSQTTVTYDVSGTVDNSRALNWVLKNNSNNYMQVGAEIDFPTVGQVRVTVGIELAAGTYTLVGR